MMLPNGDEEGECVVFSNDDLEDHTLGYMERVVEKNCEEINVNLGYQYEKGFFIVRFCSEECQKVLEDGPYNVKRKPIVTKKWEPRFGFTKEKMFVIPIWVKLHKLPLQFWGRRRLGRISKFSGQASSHSECIVKQTMVTYAMILVVTDVSQLLVKVARRKNPEDVIEQRVAYEYQNFPRSAKRWSTTVMY